VTPPPGPMDPPLDPLPAVVEVTGLGKIYDDLSAVASLSFQVAPGEILGLVGANGAGKTTTLRCLAGILPPTTGTIRICGHDLATDPVAAKRTLAFVPDEPRLFEYLTAWDHLMMVAQLYGVPDRENAATSILVDVGLDDRRYAFPGELSRGMKQKLLFACALIHHPRLLILDEPLTGLDPAAIRAMKDRILATSAAGVAVIVSSHLLDLLEELSSRILILARGRLFACGTLQEIRSTLPEMDGNADLERIFMRSLDDPVDPGATE